MYIYMCVYLCTSDGTEVVVKVFVKHDPSASLNHHEKKLQGEWEGRCLESGCGQINLGY